MYDPLKRIQ